MFKRAMALVQSIVPAKEPITALAEAIVVAPDEEQLKLKMRVEPVLYRLHELSIRVEQEIALLKREGFEVSAEHELRSLLRKLKGVRRQAAYCIYVEHPKQEEVV